MKLVALVAGIAAAQRSDNFVVNFDSEVTFKKNEFYKEFQKQRQTVADQEAQQLLGIGGRGKVSSEESSVQSKQLTKYQTIKEMIWYLNKSERPEFGRFCLYGCHCMVKGPYDLMAGEGTPVDPIDSACKRHQDCIQCAMNDFGESCPWWKPYRMNAMVDTETSQRHLICEDSTGYCKRALCECDAQLARDLFEEQKFYNTNHHHRLGAFDTGSCKSGPLGTSKTDGFNLEKKDSQCCGTNPKRFPYSPDKKECCNGLLATIGAC